MSGLRARRLAERRATRRRAVRRGLMVTAAPVVTLVGSGTGVISALGTGHGSDRARTEATGTSAPALMPGTPSPSPSSPPDAPVARTPTPQLTPPGSAPAPTDREQRTAPVSPLPYRHPDSQALDWVHPHPGDPRTAVITSRIADRPAAVWFADPDPGTIAARAREGTEGAGALRQVPVLVPYAIPDRDSAAAPPRATRRTSPSTTPGSTPSPGGWARVR
ncbi:glycoside hydrolase family 6 protein [Streptomyces roseochromogenus]|uniref:Uncharacterized protein n=1 Tax=Streptomyces roseochromogenus subsp. oscitans DS 12.976 TaxID=1352936 RepID=V6JNM5_STRRC|nr:hypothetical protein M878_37465 [Streptomyces roseochromogenus subsp. oscitans DS 12.976]